MAYTLHTYLYDSAKVKALKKLLHTLVSEHRTASFFAHEHSVLLAEINEREAAMKRYESQSRNRPNGL